MEIDVNLRKPTTANGLELKTISAGSYSNNNGHSNLHSHLHNNNNSINNHQQQQQQHRSSSSNSNSNNITTSSEPLSSPPFGCCGILSRLLCSSHTRAKTGTSSGDYNTYNNCGTMSPATHANGNSGYVTAAATNAVTATPHHNSSYMNLLKKNHTHRRTPQEIYFESRGKSCKKLLKFNGNSNKILLYPEEGWARTASSSYWTITPCWWQPNRCRIEEFAGTQRQVTKAKMVPLEQKGSLLIVGHFRSKNSSSSSTASSMSAAASTTSAASTTTSTTTTLCSPLASSSSKDNDEFKLYLSSNISMEDYNMGYCLTGFVERRCQQTNTFQMTHFAVIKRQWPSLAQNNKSTKTNSGSSSSSWSTSCTGSGGNAAGKST